MLFTVLDKRSSANLTDMSLFTQPAWTNYGVKCEVVKIFKQSVQ